MRRSRSRRAELETARTHQASTGPSRCQQNGKQFQDRLEEFFRQLDQGVPQMKVDPRFVQTFKDQIQSLNKIHDPNHQASEIVAAELHARREISRSLKRNIRVSPDHVGSVLSRGLRKSWDNYRSEILKLDESCFDPAESEIDKAIRHHAHRTKVLIDQRRRLKVALDENVRHARQRTQNGVN